MFSKTETTIRPNSSVLIKWGTPQNFLLAFIDELWNFWKIRILKKWKKHCWRYHHFKHVYQKPQSYEVQFLRYGVWQIFFVILDHFLPFYPSPPPNKSGNKSFEKSICRCHSLNLCNKNHYHMMYAYSDMESSRQFCYFKRAIFCSFTPLLTRKLKYKKNVKNPWRYYPFTHVYHKSRSYDV